MLFQRFGVQLDCHHARFFKPLGVWSLGVGADSRAGRVSSDFPRVLREKTQQETTAGARRGKFRIQI